MAIAVEGLNPPCRNCAAACPNPSYVEHFMADDIESCGACGCKWYAPASLIPAEPERPRARTAPLFRPDPFVWTPRGYIAIR